MQTENECGETNTNDWKFAEHQFDRTKTYLTAGANSTMIWNMVLDETGLSTAAWAQCSPIVVDQKTKQVTYTPYYYLYKHFSSSRAHTALPPAEPGATGWHLKTPTGK